MAALHQVVGIDQSLTGTGLALIHKDSAILPPEAPRFHTTKVKPTVYGIARLMYIEEVVNRWIPSTAELVVMEGYAMSAHGQVFMIGECGGIIKRLVHTRNIPLISVAPGTLKKYVTGKGNSPKNLMLLGAYKKFGISFDNDDECDAYSLARIGMDYLDAQAGNMPKGFEEAHKAIVKYNVGLEGGDTDE